MLGARNDNAIVSARQLRAGPRDGIAAAASHAPIPAVDRPEDRLVRSPAPPPVYFFNPDNEFLRHGLSPPKTPLRKQPPWARTLEPGFATARPGRLLWLSEPGSCSLQAGRPCRRALASRKSSAVAHSGEKFRSRAGRARGRAC